jgi:hypothetical protein
VLLTNSYVIYLKFHRSHDSKDLLPHYEYYIKQISLAWIDQKQYWPASMKMQSKSKAEDDGKHFTKARRKSKLLIQLLAQVLSAMFLMTIHCIQQMAT